MGAQINDLTNDQTSELSRSKHLGNVKFLHATTPDNSHYPRANRELNASNPTNRPATQLHSATTNHRSPTRNRTRTRTMKVTIVMTVATATRIGVGDLQ
jgi:hypothetical protein